MTDTTALLRLMSWLSPVFPTGSFAYSAGLEQAVADGAVADQTSLHDWIAAHLEFGSMWNDAVFFTHAHQNAGDQSKLSEVSDLAKSMTIASERREETCNQGTSFLQAAIHWVDTKKLPPKHTPLPICVGCVAGLEKIELNQGLSAYLHAFATNQLQAAIRLSVVGQNSAAKTLAQLEPIIANTAQRAAISTLDDLGSSTIAADIASMNHETLQPRLFLS